MFKKREFLLFSRDRLAMASFVLLALGVMLLLVMTTLNVRVSDVQVPTRYSGYGFTNLYRDKWYALLSFATFGLIILLTNSFLAVKLHAARRGLAIGLLGISLFLILVTLIIANAVFRLATFSL